MITTEIDKYKIRSSFSKAAIQYDTFALFQKEIAAELLYKITHSLPTPNSQVSTLLDIGCGTGFLTHGLAEAFRKANIFGCDIAHEMIDVARGKERARDKRIYLLAADGGVLPYKDKTFGMVASNLAYQWIHDIKTAFSEAHRVLRPGGIFTFSTLGPETLKELRYCYAAASAKFNKDGLPPFMDFADEQTIQSTMKSAGFKTVSIEKKEIGKAYPDMWALLKAMKSIGAGNPFKQGDKSLGRGSLLKRMAEVYEGRFKVQGSRFKTCDLQPATHIYATYEVMFTHAEK